MAYRGASLPHHENARLMPPKISVITVNYQMRDGLARTIRSVAGQTYPALEYLVIDGGSDDGSVDVIRESEGNIAYWVSERDSGLYDAMNKGVRAASGEWVIFMNSDDCFVDDRTIADMFAQDHGDAEIVYGHVLRRYDQHNVVRKFPAEPPSVLPWRMNCSHQSLFARRTLLLAHPFGSNISSDYEFLLGAYAEGHRFKCIDRAVSLVSAGGVSDANRLLSIRLRWQALSKLGLTSPMLALGYTYIALRAMAGQYGKRLVGQRLSAWILRHRKI